MDTKAIQIRLERFAKDRDWEQFHSPKNLSMALAGEAGELLEIFQWLTEEESRRLVEQPKNLSLAEEEIADILIYALRLADKLGIDVEKAIENKIKKNESKYPAGKVKGSAKKYDKYD